MSVHRLMRETCTVEAFTGEGAHGAVYGTPVAERCRVQESDSYQRGRDGSADRHEVDPGTVIYMRYGAVCPPRSRVTLPDGQTGTAAEVHKHAGRPAIRHLKVVVR